MIKRRRGSAKTALGQQRAELKRRAPGRQFIGEGDDSERGKQAERARVIQMQEAARLAAVRAAAREEERTREEPGVGDLLRQGAGMALRGGLRAARSASAIPGRLASAAVRLPLRAAEAALSIPVRIATALLVRTREV